MTKVSIFHEEFIPKKKSIEFVYSWNDKMTERLHAVSKPSSFKHVVLIAKDFSSDDNKSYDLIFAYDTSKSAGILYLGHWNDGVV